MINAKTIPGWFHNPNAMNLKLWVEDNSESVSWNYKTGISTLNGEVFPTHLIFSDDSAASVCKILFSDILWF